MHVVESEQDYEILVIRMAKVKVCEL